MVCFYCDNCGKLEEEEKMTATYKGLVCSECLESAFTCCSECGKWIHNDYIRTVRNRYDCEVYVCGDCFLHKYKYCSECGDYVRI